MSGVLWHLKMFPQDSVGGEGGFIHLRSACPSYSTGYVGRRKGSVVQVQIPQLLPITILEPEITVLMTPSSF